MRRREVERKSPERRRDHDPGRREEILCAVASGFLMLVAVLLLACAGRGCFHSPPPQKAKGGAPPGKVQPETLADEVKPRSRTGSLASSGKEDGDEPEPQPAGSSSRPIGVGPPRPPDEHIPEPGTAALLAVGCLLLRAVELPAHAEAMREPTRGVFRPSR